MKISKTTSLKETTTANARLKSIEEFDRIGRDGNVTPIIVIKTNHGNFSNFRTVFDAQGIDVEALQADDELEIVYTVHVAKNGVKYKNFVKVEKVGSETSIKTS